MNQLSVAGKRVLVTGASSGLGAHFARMLASEGAWLLLGARNVHECRAVARGIVAEGGRASAIALDVTDLTSVQCAVEAAVATLGGLDVLVNNAGIAPSAPFLDMTIEQWAGTLDVNLTGAMQMSQAAGRIMQHSGSGAIVNVSSITGLRPAGAIAAYAASKAGLIHMTRACALELARFGIRVNSLCPGYIETDLNRAFFASRAGQALVKRIPQRRLGQAEDLDGPLLLLCSDAGRYMTGSTVVVDGGHTQSSL